MLDIMLRIAYLSAIGLSLYTSGWLLMKADKTRTTGLWQPVSSLSLFGVCHSCFRLCP